MRRRRVKLARGRFGVALCYYCGQPADTVDHVVPQTLLSRLELVPELREELGYLLSLQVVKACHQCNLILGDKVFRTLTDRRDFVKSRLIEKYRKLLHSPEWSDDEIEELGPNLQDFVRARRELKEKILSRIRWPRK